MNSGKHIRGTLAGRGDECRHGSVFHATVVLAAVATGKSSLVIDRASAEASETRS